MYDTPTAEPERFEDRLLHSLLADFDELTPADPAPSRPHQPRRRPGPRPAWSLPALVLVGALAILIVMITRHPGTPRALHAASTSPTGAPRAVIDSPGHRLLYKLAAQALTEPAVATRYAILSEVDTETDEPGTVVRRTSVDDTLTGASITYQTPYASNPSAPPVLREGPDATQTAAYFDALPTDPTALRARLITIAKQTWNADNTAMAADAKQNAKTAGYVAPPLTPTPGPMPSDDEFVYQTASDMLWSPVVPPALRSALYKVLAGCQNVKVNANATDPAGRAAIEISQTNGYYGFFATFEDPSTGTVLAQQFSTGTVMNDEVYQPVMGSDTIPADPYGN